MSRKNHIEIRQTFENIIKSFSQSGFRPKKDCYVKTYNLLVDEASGLTKRGKWDGSLIENFIQRLFRSAWMKRATRCDIDRDVAERLAFGLNEGASPEELEKLAVDLVNGSMVGGSKFLHFCDPDRFPITDRFLRMLTGTPWHSTVQAAYYRDYRLGVAAVDDEHAQLAMKWAESAFGYAVSRVRAIEALAFYYAKAMSRGIVARVA